MNRFEVFLNAKDVGFKFFSFSTAGIPGCVIAASLAFRHVSLEVMSWMAKKADPALPITILLQKTFG